MFRQKKPLVTSKIIFIVHNPKTTLFQTSQIVWTTHFGLKKTQHTTSLGFTYM